MADASRRFVCAHCNAAFTKKHSLKVHLSNRCRSLYPVKSTVRTPFICAHCNAAYTRKDNLKTHLSNRCPILYFNKPKQVPISDKFICSDCGAAFSTKYSLKVHLSRTCPKLNLVKSKVQGVEILHFTCNEEFLLWKEEEEKRSFSKFSQNQGTWKTKRGEKTKYLCHRGGRVRSRLKDPSLRKRSFRRKGSCKINNQCTAFILSEKHSNGTVLVQYNRKHSNHSFEMKHLPLSLKDRAEFASKLKEGLSLDQILNEVRDTLCDSQQLTRKHFITKHDLHNIKAEFNISFKEQSSSKDTASVELMIDEYEKKYGTESPFLYYKQQGVEDEIFEKDDVFLVIMNSTQVNFLQKYGSDKICIDRIHGAMGDDYLLNTILVVDDLNFAVPVAHMISNKENSTFLKAFFEVVKMKCGVIKANTLISDDFPAYLDAWEEIMGSVEIHLLYTWLVDRNWKQSLSLIKNVEGSISVTDLKKEVYQAVRTVMEETNLELFPTIVDSLVQNLENYPATKDFGAYFQKEYGNRYKMWAFAFRKHIGIDTDTNLEATHRAIKTVYSKGTKNKRMDFLITALLQMNRNKVHSRMTVLLESDSHILREIRDGHEESMKIPKEDVVIINHEIALVTSQSNRSVTYTITKAKDNCDCRLRCKDCDSVCVHMYKCTCVNDSIADNFCKHIHAFIKIRISEEVYSDEIFETNFDMSADSNANNQYEEIQAQSIHHSGSGRSINRLKALADRVTHLVRNIDENAEDVYIETAAQFIEKAIKFLEPKCKM